MGQKTITKATDVSTQKPVADTRGSGWFRPVAGFVLSAVLLTVCQEPFGLSWLAWAAWVPFMLVCDERVSTRRLLISAYIVGLCYWVWNMHWLYIVTFPGYISFSIAQAFYWAALAYCVRYARRKAQWPLFVWAPLLFVGAEALQGYLYTGFCWFYLAHSQYAHLPLIQISDIFGALGVSVLVAMVNGLIADWVLSRYRTTQSEGFARLAPWRFYSTIVCIVLLAGAYFYGQRRLSETPGFVRESPLIGSVQPNVPANVKEEIDNGPKILADMIVNSKASVAAGATLVAWPETMVLAPMNPGYRYYCKESSDSVQFHQKIQDLCKEDQCYVLVGAPAVEVGSIGGHVEVTDQYNSAFLYRPNGQADPKRYDKIHLVPFGEYIPFKTSAPWIYKMILFLSPYDYDYNLTAGTTHTVFEMDADGKTYRFGVLICYEDTDPTVTRGHVLDKNGNKRCDWLVNLSNDGWYVRYKNQKVLPMGELSQRTAISAFRCVENRISIVRSVNTGISCVIESTGRIRNGYKAGNLPDKAMARQGVAGWFVDTVPIDSRVTFFSRHGRWLDRVLALFFVLNFFFSVYGSRKVQSKHGGQ